MQTIAVLNSKGGSGKTTVSINLASYYAHTGHKTVIIDYDSQGSSTYWANARTESQPHIHSIPAYKLPIGSTQTFQMKLGRETERVIIDTPGAISPQQLEKIVKRTDFIIVPVQPSSIDIHAVSDFINQLLRLRPVQWGKVKVAVVANRVTESTTGSDISADIFSGLSRFLEDSKIPFLTQIQDSHNYTQATNEAKGVFEIEPSHSNKGINQDKSDWYAIINWLEQKEVFSELSTMTNITALNSGSENQLELAI